MNSDFVGRISLLENIPRKERVEQDVILHQILADLSGEKSFADNFLFKGGTCLIKHYLGYYRFSEDLDFTWMRPEEFEGKTKGQLVRDLEKTLEATGRLLEDIAAKRGLDFKWDKGDRNYVELQNGGRITTYRIHYSSAILKKDMDLKVQTSFADRLCMGPQNKDLHSLVEGKHKDLEGVFDEYGEYSSAIPFALYDIREITSEKIRAVLTRRGSKARDFFDLYMIHKKFGISAQDVEDCAVKKISFALEHYERFRNNFAAKKRLVQSGGIFAWGEEDLLVATIDREDFGDFLANLTGYLRGLVEKLDSASNGN